MTNVHSHLHRIAPHRCAGLASGGDGAPQIRAAVAQPLVLAEDKDRLAQEALLLLRHADIHQHPPRGAPGTRLQRAVLVAPEAEHHVTATAPVKGELRADAAICVAPGEGPDALRLGGMSLRMRPCVSSVRCLPPFLEREVDASPKLICCRSVSVGENTSAIFMKG